MNRDRWEILFTLAVLVVVGVAVWQAHAWGLKPRLFPWAIGIPLMGLLVALLVTQVVRQFKSAPAAPEPPVIEEAEAVAAAHARRRGLSIVGWLLGFLVAIWLLGFPIGGTLATLAYLKLAAHERWPISLAISGGTAAFFVLMIYGLHTPFPQGALFELVGE
jgi:hypothetical protein